MTYQRLLVLKALLDYQELSGADVCRRVDFKPGSIYPILHALHRGRWVFRRREQGDPSTLGHPLRNFYALTDKGRQAARAALAPLQL